MTHRFLVYIDESGDEGFTFRDAPNKGSSDWLTLSAIIIPSELDHQLRVAASSIRHALDLRPKATIHFADLAHDKRVRAIEEISGTAATITNLLVNKRAITQPAIFTGSPFRLYFYAARLLLERISWHCRDYASSHNWSTCEAKLIFEHRKRLSYDRLRNYLQVLHTSSNEDAYYQFLTRDVRIHWPAINISKLDAAQKHDYAGLQIADCAASAMRWALESSRYANTEHRYAKLLKPRIYERNGNYMSYGLKCFPGPPDSGAANAHWLRKHYAF